MQRAWCHLMERHISVITCSLHQGVWFPAAALTNVGIWVPLRISATYGPQWTRRERTLSMPMSHTLTHSALISMQRPWKFSWSYTHIWEGGGGEMRQREDESVRFLQRKRSVSVLPRWSVWTGSSKDNTCGVMTAILPETSHIFLSVFAVTIFFQSFKKQQIVAADVSSVGKLLDSLLHPHDCKTCLKGFLLLYKTNKRTNKPCGGVVDAAYLVGRHAHLRFLALSSFPISLGSRLGLLSSSRHDWEPERKTALTLTLLYASSMKKAAKSVHKCSFRTKISQKKKVERLWRNTLHKIWAETCVKSRQNVSHMMQDRSVLFRVSPAVWR